VQNALVDGDTDLPAIGAKGIRAMPATPSARERLLDAAEKLIYRRGIRGAGTEAIIDAADTARMSLYNYFGSKEKLVVAVLKRRDDRWMAWLSGDVAARELPPGPERILAVFDALADWFGSAEFNGCAFINAAAETPNATSPIRRIALDHKRKLRAYLEGLCREAGLPQATRIAGQLFILVEGATVTALVDRESSAAREARTAARALLQNLGIAVKPS